VIALAVPAIILGGITGGIFTPTEAAVVAALYAVVIGLFILRTLTVHTLFAAARDGMLISGSVLFIAAATAVFGWILAREGMVTKLLSGLQRLEVSPLGMLLLINLILLVLGMFIEPVSGILLLAPILVPLIGPLGIEPVHFGVVLVMNLNFGLVTPPMGLALYIVSDVSGASLSSIVREMVPFYLPMVSTLLAVVAFPELALWLPRALL
jgi:C4-dicarboxylate transporter DctM subunit